jgi:hypothetical protein
MSSRNKDRVHKALYGDLEIFLKLRHLSPEEVEALTHDSGLKAHIQLRNGQSTLVSTPIDKPALKEFPGLGKDELPISLVTWSGCGDGGLFCGVYVYEDSYVMALPREKMTTSDLENVIRTYWLAETGAM